MSYLTPDELKEIGFLEIGHNVKISTNATVYAANRIKLGSNIRIDDFCVLSGNILIGDNVHLSTHVAITATQESLNIGRGSTISYGSKIFTASDDFGGDFMFNSTYNLSQRNVLHAPIVIGEFVAIGALCTVMPGSLLGSGVALGAMSLVSGTLEPWNIYVGTPARFLRARSKKLLDFDNGSSI
jgi:acetyltransferase-like isoleucine patch superfamily enzyme